MKSPQFRLAVARIKESIIAGRKSLGWSQTELAFRSGLLRTTVARAETPGVDVQLSTAIAMASSLGFSIGLVMENKSGTSQELLAQKNAIDKELASLEQQINDARQSEVGEVIAQIEALLSAAGLSVADLVDWPGESGAPGHQSHSRRRAPQSYRHPDTGETWDGLGRQPKWIWAAVADGINLDSMKI